MCIGFRGSEWGKGFSDRSEDSFSCFSYGSSSSSSSSSGLELGSKGGWRQQQQQKKMVASTGTVSTVLGKEYVRRNNNNIRNKGLSSNGVFEMEEAEQFLCSMLGDDSDINLAVVRDVLCEYHLADFCFSFIVVLIWIKIKFHSNRIDSSGGCSRPKTDKISFVLLLVLFFNQNWSFASVLTFHEILIWTKLR